MLAFLMDAYTEEEIEGEERTVLKLHPRIAPIKAAVFPLSKKEPVSTVARELYDDLKGRLPDLLRRLRVYRPPLPASGRGRYAVLRNGRLRHDG